MKFEVRKLGDIADVLSGNSAPQEKDAFKDGEVPFIRTSDVGQIRKGEIYTSRDLLPRSAANKYKLFPVGTILLPKSGASTFLNHRVITRVEAAISSHLAGIVANPRFVSAEYLYHFLTLVDAKDLVQDASYPSLNLKQIQAISVPIPPLEAQLQIVEEIDSFLLLSKNLENTAKLKTDLVSKLFDSQLSARVEEIIEEYGSDSMGELFTIARGGSPRPIKSYITTDADGVNWIKISDATRSGKYITSTSEKIKPSGVSRSRKVASGDLLLSNSMSFGRPYILKTDGCIHDGWVVLTAKAEMDSEYAYYMLGSTFMKGQFESLAQGSTVQNLNIDLISRAVMPVPPVESQLSLVQEVQSAEQLVAEFKTKQTSIVTKIGEMTTSRLKTILGVVS
jgi:restriction endonuclease S subunit